jgi:hypothetical protein
MKDTFIALWAKIATKRHGKDDCLRIPPYDHGHDNEVIVVKKCRHIYIIKKKSI